MTSLTIQQRVSALAKLGDYIRSKPELLDAYVQRSSHHNGWFTPEQQWRMLNAIANHYLNIDRLQKWISAYSLNEVESQKSKNIGLVFAGNIPLVGFHDWLCVCVAGHKTKVKLSEKDPYVFTHLIKQLIEIEPLLEGQTTFVNRLKDFDAVIATGSNNTAKYFKQYFGHVPHIIRANRTSIAVLNGKETEQELLSLGDDVFAYFGLGCRSVGKIYVPKSYNFEPLLEALHTYKQIANHTKWKNNFDYNYALLTINKEHFLATGSLLLREDQGLHSRLATLHYEFYDSKDDLVSDLKELKQELQVIVSKDGFINDSLPFGKAQQPGLSDYADSIDTMAFIQSIT